MFDSWERVCQLKWEILVNFAFDDSKIRSEKIVEEKKNKKRNKKHATKKGK